MIHINKRGCIPRVKSTTKILVCSKFASVGNDKRMKNALIICTYQRPEAICALLDSVLLQTAYPDEIVVVDGSTNDLTKNLLDTKKYAQLRYYKVGDNDRGLTRQRNYGIERISADIDIVSFLDDDTVLEPDYFEKILHAYKQFPEALGVGGYITNEAKWEEMIPNQVVSNQQFAYDGWVRKDGSRFILRKKMRLVSSTAPGFMPSFSHGRSIGFLPPSGKTYPVEQLKGGIASYKASVFTAHKFSTYFEGYGLYEDVDFSLRVSKTGKLYANTAARVAHYHDPSGRPNLYSYGKMVVRNGWYVWRVKYPSPRFLDRIKWNAVILVLMGVRATNIVSSNKRQEALTEAVGRFSGWLSLWFNPPKIEN